MPALQARATVERETPAGDDGLHVSEVSIRLHALRSSLGWRQPCPRRSVTMISILTCSRRRLPRPISSSFVFRCRTVPRSQDVPSLQTVADSDVREISSENLGTRPPLSPRLELPR